MLNRVITYIMAIRVVEFSNGIYKIRKIFAQESTYPKEIFEFWELDQQEASVACQNKSWFLGKNISNFVPPRLKTPQPVLP